MTTEFREEWRRWNEAQVIETGVKVHRMARRVAHIAGMYSNELQRRPTKVELEARRFYPYVRYEVSWPQHQFGLDYERVMALAARGNRLFNEMFTALADEHEGLERAYFDACREVAENWLWNTMQLQVSTDTIELPTDFLELQ